MNDMYARHVCAKCLGSARLTRRRRHRRRRRLAACDVHSTTCARTHIRTRTRPNRPVCETNNDEINTCVISVCTHKHTRADKTIAWVRRYRERWLWVWVRVYVLSAGSRNCVHTQTHTHEVCMRAADVRPAATSAAATARRSSVLNHFTLPQILAGDYGGGRAADGRSHTNYAQIAAIVGESVVAFVDVGIAKNNRTNVASTHTAIVCALNMLRMC